MRIASPDLTQDLEARRDVYALFDAVWPRLSERIALAERAGAQAWHRVSVPFVAYDGAQPVGHVGVLAIPLMLGGTPVVVGGIHAVGTHPRYRRRGYVRRLLEAALAYCDERFATTQLTTEVPEVFRRAGFRPILQTRVEIAAPRGRSPGFRPLALDSPADRAILDRLLRRRQPVSRRLSALDPGWLFIFDEVLATGGFTRLHYAEDLDLVAAYEVNDGRLRLYDLVAERLPRLDDVLVRIATPYSEVDLFFVPDRFDVRIVARREAYPGDSLLVRGPYPDQDGRLVLPPLAHC